MASSLNTYGSRSSLKTSGGELDFYGLEALEKRVGGVSNLPFSLKILLEGMLRHEDGVTVSAADIEALARWSPGDSSNREIAFRPGRVLLQDFTGVPSVVDLAAMRDALAEIGGRPERINPQVPAELVIDHSIQVDFFGTGRSFQLNVEKEFERNQERYAFLRWGQAAFDNFRVVPPATGIVHQVNLEYLARVVFETEENGRRLCFPDTLVGTDSHTTMVNGLGVLGWGVGGIEAEAAMLGQPISLLSPQVVGFKLYGQLPEGTTATDLVLTITQRLRAMGVVGKFVEFFGSGVSSLSLADRATIGNMSPEYGATCALFPIDSETSNYLRLTARRPEQIELVESYAKAQGWFHTPDSPEPEYSETLELDLGTVEPSLAGPKRPQDRIPLTQAKVAFKQALPALLKSPSQSGAEQTDADQSIVGPRVLVSVQSDEGVPEEVELSNGSVVIAAITSCTNTSNPSVMIGAGLLAQKAVERGLRRKPWVKTSLAPGSKVVTEYLEAAGLMPYLSQLGFNLVGYGCTTCIGNSGPLPQSISEAVRVHDLVVCAVLSGNRNFEGRISPDVRANYLASPPLVVAYALAGSMNVDLYREPLGQDPDGRDVFFQELWPSQREIKEAMSTVVSPEMFQRKYQDVFSGDERWQSLPSPRGQRFAWDEQSTYVRKPSFFEGMKPEPDPIHDITGMRVLVMVGDSVTTDHISPAGAIPQGSPAAKYLLEHGVPAGEFNSFGSRRGNHEVMMRGTFGNIRLRNLLVPGTEGGYTCHVSSSEPVSIYDAAMKYRDEGVPLLVIAGKEYGSGSSRDWAAKGTTLLGVEAVLAESFERIHRSNLIGMGVLPLEFEEGQNRETLALTGSETYDLLGLSEGMQPGQKLKLRVISEEGVESEVSVRSRIDTPNELIYFQHKGILPYVLRAGS
jgi:aconitate hydratase